jgi:hypothetical protein
VSPILVRPVREQLEHDRIIRILQTKFRRRFDVGINPGMEQNAPVGGGPSAVYPDVVLTSQDRGRKIEQIIEVETVESVNNLESLAEWVPFGRLRPAFHLYVPAAMADVAKRLCSDSNIPVSEIHSYHWVGDEMRFVPVYKAPAEGRKHVQAAANPSSGMTGTGIAGPNTPGASTIGAAAAGTRKSDTSKPKSKPKPRPKPARKATKGAKAKSAKPAKPAKQRAAAKPSGRSSKRK